MKKILRGAIVIFLSGVFTECLNIEFETLSTVYLPYTYTPQSQYKLDEDAAEQLAYDADSKLVYSVGNTNIHVIDLDDVTSPQVIHHVTYVDVDVTDVEVCGDHVFVAFDNETERENGFVDVFKAYNKSTGTLERIHHIIVGDIPDMILPVKDCNKVLVAIEAEPYINAANTQLVDNPGGIGVITFSGTPSDAYSYKIVDFEKFNARYTELEKAGVRWIYKENNNTFSNDIEPEFITLNADETKAFISLQENNAIAVFDMETEQIEDILGLGFKNWMDYSIDASDKDGGIHMQPWPVYGMFQPDSIQHYMHNGVDHLILANEGDSKDYPPFFSEEVRVEDIELSETFEGNDTLRTQMKERSRLGRLKVTTENGRNPETGQYDKLYAYGGRGFSIRRADTMELVYDSGMDMEQKTALLHPDLFNSDYEEGELVASVMDVRSDDKGPETESVTYGHIGDTTLLIVGNERPGTVAVYTIDERLPNIEPKFITLLSGVKRTNDTWDNMYDRREISMMDPEEITFLDAQDSPNGNPLLLVTGSVSGTVSVIEVKITADDENGQDPNNASINLVSKALVIVLISVCLHR